ncbi:Lrp/AsnC family transcriptional regulator [Sedimenticola sp.]|uniref:Lrp/AsnC family transcriptional regulator n=1 Tax=Sedimenticola sp. TaxID=1940285 RepID=UPI003D110EBB
MELDKLDKKILALLQQDACLTNHELAEKVGLSPSPCWRRVKRLEEEGVITSRVTLVAPATVNLHVFAYALISLENHNPETLQAFDQFVQQSPQVLECCSMSGSYDYLLKIVSHSMDDYELLLSGHLLKLKGVRSVNTSFVLNQKKSTTALPLDYL